MTYKKNSLRLGKVVFCLLVALSLSIGCNKEDKEEKKEEILYNPPDWLIGKWSTRSIPSGDGIKLNITKDKFCAYNYSGKNESCLTKKQLGAGIKELSQSDNNIYKFTISRQKKSFVMEFQKISYGVRFMKWSIDGKNLLDKYELYDSKTGIIILRGW